MSSVTPPSFNGLHWSSSFLENAGELLRTTAPRPQAIRRPVPGTIPTAAVPTAHAPAPRENTSTAARPLPAAAPSRADAASHTGAPCPPVPIPPAEPTPAPRAATPHRGGRRRTNHGITSEQFASAVKIVGNLAALSHLLALPYHTCIALRQRALFDGFRLPTLPRGRLAAPCTPEMLVALQGLNIGLSMETLTARAAQFATHLTAASENRANRTTRASTPPTPATSPSNDEAQPAPCDTAAPRLEAPATPRARMAPRPRRARDNDVTAADRLPRTGIRVLPHLADTLTRFQIRRIHREAQQAARAGRRG